MQGEDALDVQSFQTGCLSPSEEHGPEEGIPSVPRPMSLSTAVFSEQLYGVMS